MAIFFLTISILIICGDIEKIISFGIEFDDILCNLFFIGLGIIGFRIYRWYKRQIKKYTELLKEDRLDKIEYIIYDIERVRGVVYNTAFYIDGVKCKLRFPQYKCKDNDNYEYYLEPIYKKNGEFKDFIAYADKKNDYKKSIESTNEITECEEKAEKKRKRKRLNEYVNSRMELAKKYEEEAKNKM